MKSETELLREICEWLHLAGYFFWRNNQVPAGARAFGNYRAMPKYTPKGLPDIFVIKDGLFVGIEVKRPGSDTEREKNGRKIRAGKLSTDQAEFAAKLALNGGKFVTARSVEDVRNFFWYAA